MDINNFDPFAFAKEIENEPIHVVDLTGPKPVDYVILPRLLYSRPGQNPTVAKGTLEDGVLTVRAEGFGGIYDLTPERIKGLLAGEEIIIHGAYIKVLK